MIPYIIKKSAFLCLAGVTLCSFACNPATRATVTKKADKSTVERPNNKTSAADASTTQDKATETDADPCVEYSAKFCSTVGEKAPSCGAMKAVSSLMPAKACAAGLVDLAYTKTQVAEMGKKCGELVLKLCADLGEGSKSCAKVKKMTPQFPPENCHQMMEQYPQVLAELKAEEARNKPLTPELQKEIAKGAASFGVKSAPVTIVEFSDFECPYCLGAAKVATALKAKYPKQVRFVFRQFPLSFHPNAHLAAQAALSAKAQGKFWEYHDLLFANQKALKRQDLEKYAKQLKLNLKKFKADLDNGTYKQQVDDDLKLGSKVFVRGTPTMFINGERVSNPTDVALVSSLVDAQLQKK